MPENTFDIVSKIDLQEVSNAIQQALKEIHTRFDLKDSKSSIELEGKDAIVLHSIDEFKLKAVLDLAWCKQNSANADFQDDPTTHEVATKKPNAFGLYDMLGNVGEWCVPMAGKVAVLRGGTYLDLRTKKTLKTFEPLRRSGCETDEECADYSGLPRSEPPKGLKKPFLGLSITKPLQ